MAVLIKNGRLCIDDKIVAADLRIDGGRISDIGIGLEAASDKVVDADGLYVLPGFIDMHTHLDDMISGYRLADTYASGSKIAVMNGITTLYSFITQRGDATLAAAVDEAVNKAVGKAYCDFGWHLTPTRFDATAWREIHSFMERGFRSFKFYTTYREAGLYMPYERIAEVAACLRDEAIVLVHCEDDECLKYRTSDGMASFIPAMHPRLRPEASETTAVRRIIEIAERTHSRMHVVHVSTADAASLINSARCRAAITCETAPQYLHLSSSILDRPDGHRWLCTPPFRREETRRDLAEAVRFGYLDCIATDHCAFKRADKDVNGGDLRSVPSGIAGIGALPHMVWKLHEKNGERSIPFLVGLLSSRPAEILGIQSRKGALRIGYDADVLIVDFNSRERQVCSTLADAYETWPGYTSRISFEHVFLRGREVARGNKMLDENNPGGRCIQGV